MTCIYKKDSKLKSWVSDDLFEPMDCMEWRARIWSLMSYIYMYWNKYKAHVMYSCEYKANSNK